MNRYALRLLGSIPFGAITGAVCGATIWLGLAVGFAVVSFFHGDGGGYNWSSALGVARFAAICGALLGSVLGPLAFGIGLDKYGMFRSFPWIFCATALSGWISMAIVAMLPNDAGTPNWVAYLALYLIYFGGLIGFFISTAVLARRARMAG